MEIAPRTGGDESVPTRIGWELLHLLQLSVRSLEDGATRILAAQVAGLIALWTQLYTFEEALPKGLAWLAWVMLIAAICYTGTLVTPRRLARFWERVDRGCTELAKTADEPAEELELIDGLATSLRTHRDRLSRALVRSVVLGGAAISLAALAYVVDKAFYPP